MARTTHELDVNPDRLLAEVRALRSLLEEILCQLPDRAIEIGVDRLRREAEEAHRTARATGNDRWRDYAARAWDIAEEIGTSAGDHMAERAEGTRIATIQPAPPAEGDAGG